MATGHFRHVPTPNCPCRLSRVYHGFMAKMEAFCHIREILQTPFSLFQVFFFSSLFKETGHFQAGGPR